MSNRVKKDLSDSERENIHSEDDCQNTIRQCGKKALNESNIDRENLDIKILLEKVNEKMDLISDINKKFDEFKEMIVFMSKQYDDMKTYMDRIAKEMKETKRENEERKKNCVIMKEKIKMLELDSQRREQYDRNKNIEIHGVRKQKNENLKEIILRVAQKVQIIDFDINQVENIYRMNNKIEGNHGRKSNDEIKDMREKIIVQFKSKQFRNAWIDNRKKLVTNGDVFSDDNKDRIYINENLTKENRVLLWKTKLKARELNYKFVWYVNGKILCKKKEGERTLNTNDVEDIKKM